MILADTCLIEKVEKKSHKPQNYSVFYSDENTIENTIVQARHRIKDSAQ